ncbi:MAG: ribosome maturation factor RimP [Candidatus Zixiibacteriota bacterium]
MASNNEKLKEEVLNIIKGPLQRHGCEVAELAVAQYRKGTTVRVFVYSEGGVNLEKCRNLSSMLGEVLDGTDLFQNGYNLEVSSPGLDRPLQRAIDFKYRVGEVVSIQFAEVKRPTTRAKIVAAGEIEIVFENESGSFTESLANIERAKIVY